MEKLKVLSTSSEEKISFSIDKIKLTDTYYAFKAVKTVVKAESETTIESQGITTLNLLDDAFKTKLLPKHNERIVLNHEKYLLLTQSFGFPILDRLTKKATIAFKQFSQEENQLNHFSLILKNPEIISEIIYVDYSSYTNRNLLTNKLLNSALDLNTILFTSHYMDEKGKDVFQSVFNHVKNNDSFLVHSDLEFMNTEDGFYAYVHGLIKINDEQWQVIQNGIKEHKGDDSDYRIIQIIKEHDLLKINHLL